MQPIRVDSKHCIFVQDATGETFHPWGHNYAANGFNALDDRCWPKIEQDLADLQAMQANVIRVHLQFGQFMESADQPNPAALDRLKRLLHCAEQHRIYVDITGLACYQKDQRPAWYDALDDEARWTAQARFWQAVADTCASSPAVFCYDLINEPITSGTREQGWYTGTLGVYEFLQRLSLDPHGRTADQVAANWTHRMVSAIRRHDRKHLITIGMLPAWGIPLKAVADDLDFISVHIYPTGGKVPDALANLKQFDVGKPIVIEETFPLSCSVAEEREFLLRSRGIATGWIGHYPAQTPAELEALQRAGSLTLPQAMYLEWINLFKEMGPAMKTGRE